MVDLLSKARRSWNMSRIRGSDTSPERAVRAFLHGLGFRFRLRPVRLPGRPDVVLTRHRVAVFVHGCFWHRHARCRFAYTPKSNVAFWTAKFEENVARDRRVRAQLRKLGWKCVTVWECQANNSEALTRAMKPTFALTAKPPTGRMPKTFPARKLASVRGRSSH